MANAAAEDHQEHHRLTAVQGLAALSLDALSSVAYGPEAILVVLVAGGALALHYSLPITGAIVLLLAALRSITRPIVQYLCQLEEEDQYYRLVVLIPEVQPPRFWDYVLFNQRGALLDRAIRHGTVNVVLCRLRYRLEQFAPDDAGAAAQPPGSATTPPTSAATPPPG
jgi:hypothetical protein